MSYLHAPTPGGQPAREFDPNTWLSHLESVGGCYTVPDRLNSSSASPAVATTS
jgi:hypothetical protein